MRAKKVLAVVGIALAVVLVVASVAVYALSRPPTFAPYHNGVNPEARDLQTHIAVALVAAGVESPLVIVGNGTVHAMYELPPGDARDTDAWQRVVLGALAPFAPETAVLVATQFVDGNATIEWRVPAEKVLAYEAGTLTASELEAAITKTTL